MRIEYKGDIADVRAVEDAIRATNKYTKGLFRSRDNHPVQGNNPSRVLTEYYEVYPDTDLVEKRPLLEAIQAFIHWEWGRDSCVEVQITYDYRDGESSRVVIKGGMRAIMKLEGGIPGIKEALAALDCYLLSQGKMIPYEAVNIKGTQ